MPIHTKGFKQLLSFNPNNNPFHREENRCTDNTSKWITDVTAALVHSWFEPTSPWVQCPSSHCNQGQKPCHNQGTSHTGTIWRRLWVFIYLTEAMSAWWAMSCCFSCAISKLTNSKRWAVLASLKQDNPELAWLNNWPMLPQVIGAGFPLCPLIQDPLINQFQTYYRVPSNSKRNYQLKSRLF